jgi:hypothetical protein
MIKGRERRPLSPSFFENLYRKLFSRITEI